NCSKIAADRLPEWGGKIGIRQSELGMIEQIEELSAEVRANALGDCEALDHREICVHEAWAGKWRSGGRSQLADRCLSKAIRVKPLLDGLVSSGRVANLD